MELLIGELKRVAREKGCAFIRMSPFCTSSSGRSVMLSRVLSSSKHGDEASMRPSAQCDTQKILHFLGFRPSPLHMLAEHIWYLNLQGKSEEDIRKGMRATTRNLIGRAEREGVAIEVSKDPRRDVEHFLALHEETRKRHRFTPYSDAFFRAQVEKFSEKGECALYLARYQSTVIAASIHMIYGGETSYHHGASSHAFSKIPASYLLQWRAMQDALKRGDRIYNFWGVAPGRMESARPAAVGRGKWTMENERHPFAGVTTFKTGFGG
ncbi:MAG: peptidoglycan bridge formation glycyltransferase FemA/FemB family protein, partial [Patescibacteria group bacterium]